MKNRDGICHNWVMFTVCVVAARFLLRDHPDLPSEQLREWMSEHWQHAVYVIVTAGGLTVASFVYGARGIMASWRLACP